MASSFATPNCWNVPPRMTRPSPSSIAATTPVQSMTTSQPRGRSSSSALVTVAVQPSSLAVSSRAGLRSTMLTLAAPARLASSIIIRPMVPAP